VHTMSVNLTKEMANWKLGAIGYYQTLCYCAIYYAMFLCTFSSWMLFIYVHTLQDLALGLRYLYYSNVYKFRLSLNPEETGISKRFYILGVLNIYYINI
jgi:hypothetical protein